MTTSTNLTCQELVELVTGYLEGAMSAPERARFEAHLAVCPGCRNYLEQMQRTIDSLGQLTEDSIPPQTKEELLAIFSRWKADG